jgi:putative membrane protein
MPYGGPGGGAMPWEAAGGGLGPFPGLLALFVLLAVLVAVAYLVRQLVGEGTTARGDDALRVLETRYARGEVDDEEFERRRDRLAADP